MRWLFPGKEITVESRCLDCGDIVRIRMKDEDLLEVEPETAVGYMTSPVSQSRLGSTAYN